MNIIIVAMITAGYAEWHVRWISSHLFLLGIPWEYMGSGRQILVSTTNQKKGGSLSDE
jgi:hypothetical protein